ncbi:unnamed protein product [Arabidopsis halleri]
MASRRSKSESCKASDKEDDEASKEKDEDTIDDGDYESVSRKRLRKTTTILKRESQKRRLKRKMSHNLCSRSFRAHCIIGTSEQKKANSIESRNMLRIQQLMSL